EFGLIGKVLGHSFSARYFNEKFQKEGIDASYSLFPLENIDTLPDLIEKHPLLKGLNVTIPYKVEVMKYLDELSEEAREIGAVNVIKIFRKSNDRNYRLKGYNSDAYGFTESMKQVLESIGYDPSSEMRKPLALILGTGGASRAVVWSMRKIGFDTQLVGRSHREDCLAYGELTPELICNAKAVVNCTPLGTSPDINSCAPFPYEYLHEGQICFDLVYNPEMTLFMTICKAHGCTVSNGMEMLRLQAVGAWKIWTEKA
ncbi:MAG: shikimate dehydrogenase, partial [Muribaculaceae bacterium]|nr:shikimate dehydrogenase [Muribaculaceae bacterium]